MDLGAGQENERKERNRKIPVEAGSGAPWALSP